MQRKWTITTDLDEMGNAFLDWGQVEASMSEAVGILHRLGGAITVAALRDELEDGSFEPQGFVFVWDSFVPAQRRQSKLASDAAQRQADGGPSLADAMEPVEAT